MIQVLLVLVIVAFTVVYSIYAIVKNIRKEESPCGDCNGCDVKKEITRNLKTAKKHPSTCGCNPE